MIKRIVLILLFLAAVAVGVWTGLSVRLKWQQFQPDSEPSRIAAAETTKVSDTWDQAVAKVKEDRPDASGVRVETPPELQHYPERHWFLATQVAEIAKYGVHTCQDYMDLAAMIERGEMVTLPEAEAKELREKIATVGEEIVKDKPGMKPMWDMLTALAKKH